MKARTLKKWSILLLAALLLPACGNRQGQDPSKAPQGEPPLQVTQEADKESTAAPSKEPQAGDVTTEATPGILSPAPTSGENGENGENGEDSENGENSESGENGENSENPSGSVTPEPEQTPTPSPAKDPGAAPTPVLTPAADVTPTPSKKPGNTSTPTPTPSKKPSVGNTSTPTPTPSKKPSVGNTSTPTPTPTKKPTKTPTPTPDPMAWDDPWDEAVCRDDIAQVLMQKVNEYRVSKGVPACEDPYEYSTTTGDWLFEAAHRVAKRNVKINSAEHEGNQIGTVVAYYMTGSDSAFVETIAEEAFLHWYNSKAHNANMLFHSTSINKVDVAVMAVYEWYDGIFYYYACIMGVTSTAIPR